MQIDGIFAEREWQRVGRARNLTNDHKTEETKDMRACRGHRRDGMCKAVHIGEVQKSTRRDTVNTSGGKYRLDQGTSVAPSAIRKNGQCTLTGRACDQRCERYVLLVPVLKRFLLVAVGRLRGCWRT